MYKRQYVSHEAGLAEADDMIDNIIHHHEIVSVDNTSIRNNQLIVNGTVSFGMMYYTNGSDMAKGTEGEIPFEETIKLNALDENCNADVSLVVLSSSVKLIDSKSYIYKVQIMANITIKKMEDLEAVSEIQRENVMVRHSDLDTLCVVADKSDTFRVSERLSVPSGKPAIQKIIWQDVKIKTINTKMLDGMIHIGGELKVFLIYIPEDDETESYKLVTTVRGNSMKGLISIDSPLGKAIKGRKTGDKVYIKVNDTYGYEAEIRSIDKTAKEEEDQLRSY